MKFSVLLFLVLSISACGKSASRKPTPNPSDSPNVASALNDPSADELAALIDYKSESVSVLNSREEYSAGSAPLLLDGGWVVAKERYTNRSTQPLILWIFGEDPSLRIRTQLRYDAPRSAETENGLNWTISSAYYHGESQARLSKMIIHRENLTDGMAIKMGEWNRLQLDPKETIHLEWMATPAPGAVHCPWPKPELRGGVWHKKHWVCDNPNTLVGCRWEYEPIEEVRTDSISLTGLLLFGSTRQRVRVTQIQKSPEYGFAVFKDDVLDLRTQKGITGSDVQSELTSNPCKELFY